MNNDPNLEQQVNELRHRVALIEQRLPQSNIISPKFWFRAWTVLGHNLAITGLIYAGILAVTLIFFLIGLVVSAGR